MSRLFSVLESGYPFMSYSVSKQAFLLLIIVRICGLSFEGSMCAVSEIGRTDAIIPSKSIVLPRKCIWVISFFDQIKHSRNENRVKKVWIWMGLLKDYNFVVGRESRQDDFDNRRKMGNNFPSSPSSLTISFSRDSIVQASLKWTI